MHQISIDASPHQLRKLKRGHKVRVKMGCGFNLLVHPDTYNIVSRAFNKNKGVELSLSPQELEHNADVLSSGGPMAGPTPEQHTTNANLLLNEEEEPEEGEVSGSGLRLHGTHVKLTGKLNKHLGTNYGYMARSGLEDAMANKESARLSKMSVDARKSLAPNMNVITGGDLPPRSRMVGGAIERSSVQQKGRLLGSVCPPACVSQPYSANWQMQFFLPPQYKKLNNGTSMNPSGSGLYA